MTLAAASGGARHAIGAPHRVTDHFSAGLAAATRIVGTTYTTGTTARVVAVLASPGTSAAVMALEVKDAGGTFRRIGPTLHADGTLTQRGGQGVVPPNTDYRWVNVAATWTIDAAYECDL